MTVSFQAIQCSSLNKVLKGTFINRLYIALNKIFQGKILSMFLSLCNNGINYRAAHAFDCGKSVTDRTV